MFGWILKSLKRKAVVVLIISSIVPLIVLGTITNLVATDILERKINFMANQTLEKLSQNVSKDLQSFFDFCYYYSRNYYVGSTLKSRPETFGRREAAYYTIKSIDNSFYTMGRIYYPYHYIIIANDGTIYSNLSFSGQTDYSGVYKKISGERWFKSLTNTVSESKWIGPSPNHLFYKGEEQVYFACNIIHQLENVGVMVMSVNRSFLSRTLDNSRMSERSSIYIIDSEGNCIAEGKENHYGFGKLPRSFVEDIIKNRDIPKFMDLMDTRQMIVHKEFLFRGVDKKWQIVMTTPVQDIHKDIKRINYITFMLTCISLILISFLIYLMNREIINPVIQLNSLMTEVKAGNLDVKAVENRNDEIGQLGNGFNSMISNIKEFIWDIKEKESAKRLLEIKVLQSQIKPHFVRNILNTIRWMAEMKKAMGVSHAIMSFARLLDYNFKDAEMMSTVKEEMEYLEGYIYLQQLRYQNKFSSRIAVDEEIWGYRILKLSFQPIVENSIVHGLTYKQGKGKLEITGRKEDGRLVFEICDDGVGMDKEILERIFRQDKISEVGEKSKGIALANVQSRIKMNFGDEYGIIIESEKGRGTRVKMIVPLLEHTQEVELQNEASDS